MFGSKVNSIYLPCKLFLVNIYYLLIFASMKELGLKLKHFRVARGLTQAELAKLCGISHKNVISSYERGIGTPSITKTLPKICKVLGVEMEIILTSRKK